MARKPLDLAATPFCVDRHPYGADFGRGEKANDALPAVREERCYYVTGTQVQLGTQEEGERRLPPGKIAPGNSLEPVDNSNPVIELRRHLVKAFTNHGSGNAAGNMIPKLRQVSEKRKLQLFRLDGDAEFLLETDCELQDGHRIQSGDLVQPVVVRDVFFAEAEGQRSDQNVADAVGDLVLV